MIAWTKCISLKWINYNVTKQEIEKKRLCLGFFLSFKPVLYFINEIYEHNDLTLFKIKKSTAQKL